MSKTWNVIDMQRKAAHPLILECVHTARNNQIKKNINELFQPQWNCSKTETPKGQQHFPHYLSYAAFKYPAIPLNLHYSYGNRKLIWHTLTCFSSQTIKRAFNWKLTFISFQIKCHRSVFFLKRCSISHKNNVFKNKLASAGFNANLFTKGTKEQCSDIMHVLFQLWSISHCKMNVMVSCEGVGDPLCRRTFRSSCCC